MLGRTDGDIISEQAPGNYVVCGFFTGDYRPLAEQLASNLGTRHPHHLFFREKRDATWRDIVRWKPDIVLQAMGIYPSADIVLLDVDCSVRGSLEPMLDFEGDVSAYPTLRLARPWLSIRKRTILHITSRSMVFKPNARVKKFVAAWREECKDPHGLYRQSGCEMAMRFALLRSVGLAFCPMDVRYSGRELAKAPADAVIVHDSASRGKR
jgi:hypothetical protein